MLLIYLIREMPPEIAFAVLLAYFLAICVAMSFHEFAHSYVAYKCGDMTPKLSGRLTLNPFAHFSGLGLLSFFFIGFGWAKPVRINPQNFRNYKKGMIAVSLSGVLTNLVLAFLFSGIFYLLVSTGVLFSTTLYSSNLLITFLYYFIYFTIFLNFALFIFNLLPIYPLDGFNFIATFLRYDNKFVQFMYQFGFVVLLIMIIPIFNGQSLLGMFYSNVVSWIINLFMSFWQLFF